MTVERVIANAEKHYVKNEFENKLDAMQKGEEKLKYAAKGLVDTITANFTKDVFKDFKGEREEEKEIDIGEAKEVLEKGAEPEQATITNEVREQNEGLPRTEYNTNSKLREELKGANRVQQGGKIEKIKESLNNEINKHNPSQQAQEIKKELEDLQDKKIVKNILSKNTNAVRLEESQNQGIGQTAGKGEKSPQKEDQEKGEEKVVSDKAVEKAREVSEEGTNRVQQGGKIKKNKESLNNEINKHAPSQQAQEIKKELKDLQDKEIVKNILSKNINAVKLEESQNQGIGQTAGKGEKSPQKEDREKGEEKVVSDKAVEKAREVSEEGTNRVQQGGKIKKNKESLNNEINKHAPSQQAQEIKKELEELKGQGIVQRRKELEELKRQGIVQKRKGQEELKKQEREDGDRDNLDNGEGNIEQERQTGEPEKEEIANGNLLDEGYLSDSDKTLVNEEPHNLDVYVDALKGNKDKDNAKDMDNNNENDDTKTKGKGKNPWFKKCAKEKEKVDKQLEALKIAKQFIEAHKDKDDGVLDGAKKVNVIYDGNKYVVQVVTGEKQVKTWDVAGKGEYTFENGRTEKEMSMKKPLKVKAEKLGDKIEDLTEYSNGLKQMKDILRPINVNRNWKTLWLTRNITTLDENNKKQPLKGEELAQFKEARREANTINSMFKKKRELNMNKIMNLDKTNNGTGKSGVNPEVNNSSGDKESMSLSKGDISNIRKSRNLTNGVHPRTESNSLNDISNSDESKRVNTILNALKRSDKTINQSNSLNEWNEQNRREPKGMTRE